MREAERDGQQVVFFPSGKKGGSTLRFRRLEVKQAWSGFSDRPEYADAQAMAHALAEAYTRTRGRPRRPRLQRVHLAARAEGDGARHPSDPAGRARAARRRPSTTRPGATPDFIYEPEPEEILARLLPVYVETELYRALLESAASEQGARMTAMRNASKAAGELIDSLTLAMNRARQAEITQEILEVVAGADALSGLSTYPREARPRGHVPGTVPGTCPCWTVDLVSRSGGS